MTKHGQPLPVAGAIRAASSQISVAVRVQHYRWIAHTKETEMSEQNAVVAVYGTHQGAEEGVKELQRSGVDMRTLSLSLIHIWSRK